MSPSRVARESGSALLLTEWETHDWLECLEERRNVVKWMTVHANSEGKLPINTGKLSLIRSRSLQPVRSDAFEVRRGQKVVWTFADTGRRTVVRQ